MRRPPRAALLGGALAALLAVALVVVLMVRSLGPEKTIEVYADSSLRHAFAELGTAFEDEHDVRVDLTVDSAGGLTAALADGAAADVLAAADPVALFQANGLLTGEPLVLAEDRLVLAVPSGNPAGIEKVRDLRGEPVAVCFIDEACGRLARLALDSARIEVEAVVGADSASTMASVLDGTADAGLVMASEAAAAGDEVEVLRLPWAGDRVSYPSVALLSGASDPDEGQEFIDFALGSMGQDILAEHGLASAENPHLQPED